MTTTKGVQRFNSFGRFGFLDGKVCPVDDRVFTSHSLSPLHCAALCLMNRECRSVFYSTSSGNCYGCAYVSNGRGLDEESENVYYIRTDDGVVLAGNSSQNTDRGLVLVWHAGQWGTVCDDNWKDGDAGYTGLNEGVLCKTLDFNSSGLLLPEGTFSLPISDESAVQIWIDGMSCNGTEAHILNCSFNGFGDNNCQHYEDISVHCF